MTDFRTFARKAAAFAPALVIFGTATAGVQRARADATVQTAASTASVNYSDYRLFGMVDGVKTDNPFVKDASGNYTNPDAKIAYKALSIYVTEALRYPVHVPYDNPADKSEWDYTNRFEAIDNPGKLPGLVRMFKEGNDRVKAIVLATAVVAHNSAVNAMRYDVCYMNNPNAGSLDADINYAMAHTTDDKLAALTARIAGEPNPADPDGKTTVMQGIWASTNTILDRARTHKEPVVVSAAQRASEYGDYRGPIVAGILQAAGYKAPNLVADNQFSP